MFFIVFFVFKIISIYLLELFLQILMCCTKSRRGKGVGRNLKMTSLDNILKLQFYKKKASWKLSKVPEEKSQDEADDEQEQQAEDENNNVLPIETTSALSCSPDLPEDIEIFCGAEEALNASTAFLKLENYVPLTPSEESWSFMLEAADVAHSSPIPDDCDGRALRVKIYNKSMELKHLVELALEEEKKRLLYLPPDPEIQLSQYPEPPSFHFTRLPETHLQGPDESVCSNRGQRTIKTPLFSRATCRGRGRGRSPI